ncbi:MAG: lipid-A-disaccharide synthase, partial [Saprospiraceae bacterium]
KTIALLPGSRQQEVLRILPAMLSVTPFFPEFEFVIAGATALPDAFYAPFLTNHPTLRLVRGNTYDLLGSSVAALVKSGTSTLETALVGTPQVVCYAGSPLSFAIAKRVVNVPYISLVNLILDRPLVCELIQDDLNTEALKNALREILEPENADAIQVGYLELRQRLGTGGASERAAHCILNMARPRNAQRL